MYQVTASKTNIPFCRVEENVKADRALRLAIIGNAFVISILIRYAVSASKAMSDSIFRPPTAHMTVLLSLLHFLHSERCH
jgi:hypothetical protein